MIRLYSQETILWDNYIMRELYGKVNISLGDYLKKRLYDE